MRQMLHAGANRVNPHNIELLGAHYLSAKLVHYLSGFMLRDLGVHNEADRIFR